MSPQGADEAAGNAEGARAVRHFDVARFAELRQARGLGWGSPSRYARETRSTNDDALAAARSGGEHGSVFITDHQTDGRGRRGKAWVAAAGQHLLVSILLRQVAAAAGVGALTLAVGLGVRHALEAHAEGPLAVKWPNDVLAGSRKLAGILCEGQFEGGRLDAVVVGIGVNVLAGTYSADLAPHVTCLEALAPRGARLEREALLVDVLEAVESRVRTYLEAGFGALLGEFSRHDALTGKRVEVSGGAPLVGVARGVDAAGRLLVESDGLLVPVFSGTVRTLPR